MHTYVYIHVLHACVIPHAYTHMWLNYTYNLHITFCALYEI